ncbi:MAG: agmatinase family protein [Bacteroidia bacterium]|nr:agmatinase family protein [Bacteroidia bacterium]MDW8332627.1 agmatinase family protein [Bacteroidia bacterium]
MNPAQSKQLKIQRFDPDDVGKINGNLFGLPFNAEESEVVVVPAPWEVTVSYRSGTADGPEAVLAASPQLDLYDEQIPDAWKLGVAMLPLNPWVVETNGITRRKSRACIEFLENGGDAHEADRLFARTINEACEEFRQWMYRTADEWLKKNKLVGVLGGEHSVPLGLIQALADRYESFGVLQIDAHADLRVRYTGFDYSHASIAHNIAQIPNVEKIVQVGVRDYCRSEADYIAGSGGRIVAFPDREIKRAIFEGLTFASICERIVDALPSHVYLTFDIDGLHPSLCPNTGTPVPGGLLFEESVYLIRRVVESGRTIIGFDLCEVGGGNEWDAIVGARLLYQIANLSALSQGRFASVPKPQGRAGRS